jgi:hypothetical protein
VNNLRKSIILGMILVLMILIISVLVAFNQAPNSSTTKKIVIADSEQWLHLILGDIELLIVTYEKEQVENEHPIKTIQIIQTEGPIFFIRNG